MLDFDMPFMTEIKGETLPLTDITYLNFLLFNTSIHIFNNTSSSKDSETYLLIIFPLNPL